MSDVLAFVKNQALLLTGLVNPQVVRTADMVEMKCIVFVRGKVPGPDILSLAEERDIVVMTCPKRMYEACGLLYSNGLRGIVMETIRLVYPVEGGDLIEAGEASSKMKLTLKKLGLPQDVIRRASICMYEGEINMVIHADGGQAEVEVDANQIVIRMTDTGPGIPDVEQAMQEGYSTAGQTARELGFGAGMGLPNMKRYSDEMTIDTEVGKGTTVTVKIKVS